MPIPVSYRRTSLLLDLLLSLVFFWACPVVALPTQTTQFLATVAKADITVCAARKFTFVAGYTNGYLYYLPTAAQRQIPGYAQEDYDCLVGPPSGGRSSASGRMRCWSTGQSSSTFQCRDSDTLNTTGDRVRNQTGSNEE